MTIDREQRSSPVRTSCICFACAELIEFAMLDRFRSAGMGSVVICANKLSAARVMNTDLLGLQ
jgi:hypothetical protein